MGRIAVISPMAAAMPKSGQRQFANLVGLPLNPFPLMVSNRRRLLPRMRELT